MPAFRAHALAASGRLELRCPPLPHTLVEAMDLLAHPERMEVRPVTRMVERDPLLAAKILHRVNSAYHRLERTMTSTEHAVKMLGPVTVVGIVAGMSMLRLRPATQGATGAYFSRLVAHSLATAELTRFLVDTAPYVHGGQPPPRDGTAFTAGLLHDFGKLVLAYNHPDAAAALYQDGPPETPAADLRQRERRVFGYDHTEAGELAAVRLRFADVLADVVCLHHRPEALAGREGVTPATARLLRATSAASLAASAMGHGTTASPSWEQAAHNPLWKLIAARDLPGFGSAGALVVRLRALKASVGEFASTVVEAPAPARLPVRELLR